LQEKEDITFLTLNSPDEVSRDAVPAQREDPRQQRETYPNEINTLSIQRGINSEED
jgi:hypothetical protein